MLSVASGIHVVARHTPRSQVPARKLTFGEMVHYGFPTSSPDVVMRKWKRHNLPNFFRGLWRIVAARTIGIPYWYGQLCLCVVNPGHGRVDYGLVSLRVITNDGANIVAKTFAGTAPFTLTNFKYHGLGVGGAAESASNTALGSELVNYYNPVNTRTVGQVSVVDSNAYRVFSSVEINNSVSVREHGVFSQAATNTGSPTGGYLLDRSLINPVPVLAGAGVECDYRLVIETGV